MTEYMPYLWLAITVFMAVCEIATVQLVSIWFVIGAVASLITSLFTDDIMTQVLVFVAVSVISLLVTRPFVKKAKGFTKTSTNADKYIGMNAQVISTIDNSKGEGQVNVSGNIWSARSLDNSIIESGTQVKVENIEGVKLIVSKIN